MKEELFTLQILLDYHDVPDPTPDEMRSILQTSLPTLDVEYKSVEQNQPVDHRSELVELTPEDESYLRQILRPEDYELLGREYGDLSGLTRKEYGDLGFGTGGGGGGDLWDFIVQVATTDAPLALGTLTAATVTIKTIIDNYFQKDAHRALRLKRGDDEIELTGLSVEEAKELADKFFQDIRRDKLS